MHVDLPPRRAAEARGDDGTSPREIPLTCFAVLFHACCFLNCFFSLVTFYSCCDLAGNGDHFFALFKISLSYPHRPSCNVPFSLSVRRSVSVYIRAASVGMATGEEAVDKCCSFISAVCRRNL